MLATRRSLIFFGLPTQFHSELHWSRAVRPCRGESVIGFRMPDAGVHGYGHAFVATLEEVNRWASSRNRRRLVRLLPEPAVVQHRRVHSPRPSRPRSRTVKASGTRRRRPRSGTFVTSIAGSGKALPCRRPQLRSEPVLTCCDHPLSRLRSRAGLGSGTGPRSFHTN